MEKIRVLLAEDERAARVMLREFFQEQPDMELCACARDGFEALELIRECAPDVLLLDLILPGLDGMEVLELLKRRPPERAPAAIVTSQVSDTGLIRKCLKLGARFYLVKPLDLNRLLRLIREICAGGSPEKEAKKLLGEMGAPKCMGLDYAAEAAAALAGDGTGRMLLKEAYYDIIVRERTTGACVEKNIRHAVKKIHEQGREPYRAMMGGLPPRQPGNGVFLRRLAEKLREK